MSNRTRLDSLQIGERFKMDLADSETYVSRGVDHLYPHMTKVQRVGGVPCTSYDGGRYVISLDPPPATPEAGQRAATGENIPQRPTLQEEAERLLDYWERHGDNPEAVEKWAVADMIGILRYIVEEGA